ncbi:MAG: PilZ domain-containing protein [Terracidiphilus sp.]|nr:PilZ domain-containing protein [Terracidiphilus sp.]
MNTAIIGAYNVESGRLLGAEFVAVDAANEPLRVIKILMEGLAPGVRGGYWLVDFHGVPIARAQYACGLLYLDESHRVLQVVEISPESGFEPIRGVPMSALVVPSQAIAASRTKAGDQLALSLLRRTTATHAEGTGPQVPPIPPRSRVVSIEATRSINVPVGHPQQPIRSGPLLNSTVAVTPPADVDAFESEKDAVQNDAAAEPEVEKSCLTEPGETAAPAEGTEGTSSDTVAEEPAGMEVAEGTVEGGESLLAPPAREVAALTPVSEQATVPQDASESIARALERRTPEAEDRPLSLRVLYSLFPELHPEYRPDFVAPRADDWKEKKLRNPEPAPYVRVLSFLYPELGLETVVRRQHEKRRAPRIAIPGLVGYYYTGGASKPHEIRSLSLAGFFMCTNERWLPGTIVRITLQKPASSEDDPELAVTVNCRVVNVSKEGTGFEFVLPGLFD